MARVKAVSLEATKTLGKLITFGNWKGVLFAMRKRRNLPRTQSRSEIIQTRQFGWYMTQARYLRHVARYSWKKWVTTSDYTWRDMYVDHVSQFWEIAHLCPLIINPHKWFFGSPELTIQFLISNFYIVPGTGWGTLAWGASPFGHASKFTAKEGAPLYVPYKILILHPPGRPVNKRFYNKTQRFTCRVPPPPMTKEEQEAVKIPAGDLDGTITPSPRFREQGTWADEPNCALAHILSWNRFITAPTITDSSFLSAQIWQSHGTRAGHKFFWHRAELPETTVKPPDEITPASWQFVTNVKIPITWTNWGTLGNWKLTFTYNGQTKTPGPGPDTMEFEPAPDYLKEKPLHTFHNEQTPPSNCPYGNNMQRRHRWFTDVKFTVDEHYPQNQTVLAEHPPVPFWMTIVGLPGNPPIVCPPMLIEGDSE